MRTASQVDHRIDSQQRMAPISIRPKLGSQNIINPLLFDPRAASRPHFMTSIPQSSQQKIADEARRP
jgi:hypothetical protein